MFKIKFLKLLIKYIFILLNITINKFFCFINENKSSMNRKSRRVRAATRMLILVVTCYLLANILDVFIATWEYIDRNSLAACPGFYTIVTDISSLLSVVSSSARLPIYLLVGDPLLSYHVNSLIFFLKIFLYKSKLKIQIKKSLCLIWNFMRPFDRKYPANLFIAAQTNTKRYEDKKVFISNSTKNVITVTSKDTIIRTLKT